MQMGRNLSPSEIDLLRRMLTGSKPLLWLPAKIGLEGQNQRGSMAKTRPEFIVPPTYSDVTGEPSSPLQLWETLQQAETALTICALAGLNILLELSHLDPGLEAAAIEAYVRPGNRPSEVTNEPNEKRPDYSFVFNRVGVLIALKCAIAGLPDVDSSPKPFDSSVVGELVLRANAFINSSKFQGLTQRPSDLEIAAEVMPTWELTNPRDLAYGMARTYRMLEFLEGDDSIVQTLTAQLGIAVDQMRFDGLSMQDFVAIVFGLHAHFRQLDPRLLLKNPRVSAVNRERFLKRNKFSSRGL